MFHKHPKTYHVDYSNSIHSDDKIKNQNENSLFGQEVVATIKYDGENSSLYSNYIHARSIDSRSNWTRDYIKKIHSNIKYQIPENCRLVCENLFAKHSIFYPEGYLDNYIYLLFVFDQNNNTIHFDEQVELAQQLNLATPKVIYRGDYNPTKIKQLINSLDTSLEEGFVVRKVQPFHYSKFASFTEKYVRPNHLNLHEDHWLKSTFQNGLPKNLIKSNKPKI